LLGLLGQAAQGSQGRTVILLLKENNFVFISFLNPLMKTGNNRKRKEFVKYSVTKHFYLFNNQYDVFICGQ